jgi:hypothetical protein
MTALQTIKLTKEQTAELKSLWTPIRRNQLVDDRKSAPIWVKLTEAEATLSKAQLFAAATILADLEIPMPSFIHTFLYGTQK